MGKFLMNKQTQLANIWYHVPDSEILSNLYIYSSITAFLYVYLLSGTCHVYGKIFTLAWHLTEE